MKKEKEQPVIHQFSDYFAAKKDASDYFLEKRNHDCGTVIDEKRETKEGLYISFRSAQDETFRERYQVLIK